MIDFLIFLQKENLQKTTNIFFKFLIVFIFLNYDVLYIYIYI